VHNKTKSWKLLFSEVHCFARISFTIECIRNFWFNFQPKSLFWEWNQPYRFVILDWKLRFRLAVILKSFIRDVYPYNSGDPFPEPRVARSAVWKPPVYTVCAEALCHAYHKVQLCPSLKRRSQDVAASTRVWKVRVSNQEAECSDRLRDFLQPL
jgi:hypothetical protein